MRILLEVVVTEQGVTIGKLWRDVGLLAVNRRSHHFGLELRSVRRYLEPCCPSEM